MNTKILYELVHCLFCMGMLIWLVGKAVKKPGYPALYAMVGAAACFFLGDAYWLAHLIVRGGIPAIFSACDVAYLGIWLMLNALLPRTNLRATIKKPFAAGMGVFVLCNGVAWYLWNGSWFNNALWMSAIFVLTVRCSSLVEETISPKKRNTFFVLLALLMASQYYMLLREGSAYGARDVVCTVLWLLSLVQLVLVLRKDTTERLTVPAWFLLVVFCELASFLMDGGFYYVFQALTVGFFAFAARAVYKEKEAHYAG